MPGSPRTTFSRPVSPRPTLSVPGSPRSRSKSPGLAQKAVKNLPASPSLKRPTSLLTVARLEVPVGSLDDLTKQYKIQ